ncbi:(+)-neomenthol dehydrogenase-like [Prunus yedoensis var. nudiflora]|uniref:(+)-neomenthol dehydrogenase-like n=1 Tax=Prunus yedoensis var. nudiflora TaxID=2094558 RepID=A0A314Z657_PRUYE|nr:(+)-neomenthol dehydrogenase-like [Prunus yedoensis var. nudiflora]
MTVLTARDEKKGIEAVEKLKECGHSDLVDFHQLDVTDPPSIASLADFVTTQFGKLDISWYVNNAGINGTIMDPEALRAAAAAGLGKKDVEVNWSEMLAQTFQLAEECIKTNYYGTKKMTKAFVPLLQLSDSPRVVNISSGQGRKKKLTEERIEEVLNEFLRDFKEDMLETECWPPALSAYILSKAALNAYTRIVAKKYPNFCVNCICPGFVKTDMTFNAGIFTVDEAAENVMRLAVFPSGIPSGLFFFSQEVTPF